MKQAGRRIGARALLAAAMLALPAMIAPAVRAAGPTVVINEVHYHPADDSRGGEFVELYNFGPDAVDIGGWLLDGARYTFPLGTVIAPGSHLVVAADPGALLDRHEIDPAVIVGPYEGTLDNQGERLRLWNTSGYLVSFVEYQDSDAWPEEPDGLGPSLERLSPLREEVDARAWAASIPVGGTPGRPNSVRVDADPRPRGEIIEVVPAGARWAFFRGREAPPPGWNDLGFDDSGWEFGDAGFGYGDDDDATVLDDMRDTYLTVFIRRTFEIEDPGRVALLTLLVDFDDGFAAWINGQEIARQNVDNTSFDAPATQDHEAGFFERFTVRELDGLLRPGTNVIALSGHNGDLVSSDLTLSPALEVELLPPDLPPAPPPTWEPAPRRLKLNELHPAGEGDGWVEIFNTADEPEDASGFRVLALGPAGGDAAIPAGTVVPPPGHLVLGESQLGFALDGIHALILATDDGRFVDGLNPRVTGPQHSTGRYPDGGGNRVVFTSPTRGAPNAIDLESPVVINEIMYHPAEENAGGEFIELFNRSAEPVDLSGWSFTRGVAFTFPAGLVVQPSGFVVLARDPAAAAAHYAIGDVLGPYEGRLKNDAETLLLRDALGNPRDRVRYADEGSWPESADGLGPSVELVHPGIENRGGAAWAASEGEGTPGAPNSRLTDDPQPYVALVRHRPPVPTSAEPVRVEALVADEREVTAVSLFYEVDESRGGPVEVPMVDDGIGDDGVASNGVWGGDIPPLPDGSIVAFWITADAAGGQSVIAPPDAPRPSFLYEIDDEPHADLRPLYRIVMRADDFRELRSRGNGSDVLLDATFISDDAAYYNRGLRYRGSSARSCNPLSYRVQFDHDVDFHGIKRLNLNGCATGRQWIGLDLLRRTGIPTPRAWFRRLSINGDLQSGWFLRVETIDDAFLEHTMPGDDSGNLYRGRSQANLDYRGEEFGPYRPHYSKVTNELLDDYSDVVDLCFRFDSDTTGDGEFVAAIEERVDADQWARYFAAFALLGSTENSILLNNGDDYFLYHRFSDNRWVLLPWDLDSCFDDEGQRLFRPTVDAIQRFLRHPFYASSYWCDLRELIDSAFAPELINSRIDHLVPLFPPGFVGGLRSYASARRAFIEARLVGEVEIEQITGGSICAGVVVPAGPTMSLIGRAPGCGTVAVTVNGAPASWDPVSTTWSARMDVDATTALTVLAIDRDGAEVDRLELELETPDAIAGPERHEQAEASPHLAMKAADFQAVTDPDEDGAVWLVRTGVASALGARGRVLRAPDGGRPGETGQSTAIYRLLFRRAGTYRAYFRARGFDGSSNTFWRPAEFDTEPAERQPANRSGAFAWFDEGAYVVTDDDVAGERLFEFRVGVREPRLEIDAIVLSVDQGGGGTLDPATLDAIVTSTVDDPIPPRARITVEPATEIDLVLGLARATLDGVTSHDGSCGTDGLAYLWEKVSGPEGSVFRDAIDAPSVEVEFLEPGEFVFRLTVTRPDGDTAASEATITVTGPPVTFNSYLLCDSNSDGEISISDSIFSLLALFGGGTSPRCAAATDCNSDGRFNLTDPIFSLNYLFLAGESPAAPFPQCDEAPSTVCATATCQ